MNKTLVVIFSLLALTISGCASSPDQKPSGTNRDAQYRMLVQKDKIIEVINRNAATKVKRPDKADD